jgi:hypothetical protein
VQSSQPSRIAPRPSADDRQQAFLGATRRRRRRTASKQRHSPTQLIEIPATGFAAPQV